MGELPIVVIVPPNTMQVAIGSSRCPNGNPVRAAMRLATGKNSAITAGFCINPEIDPATAESANTKRLSVSPASRNIKSAARLIKPVCSIPALKIMIAKIEITALDAKPENSCVTGTRPVNPNTTSSSIAARSTLSHSVTNKQTVSANTHSTSNISKFSTMLVSKRPIR